MKITLILIIAVLFNTASKAQLLEKWSQESRFSYCIHRNFDFGLIYGDSNFLEKPAYLNVVFKLNKNYEVTFFEIVGRANELMKTEIEKALKRGLNKISCDSLNIKVKKYYSFPLLFRVKQVAITYDESIKNDKKPKEFGEGFKEKFYVDLITSFNEFKNLSVVFKKPVVLLPIVDLEIGRGNMIEQSK
ncbi:MAG: hypothetical protein SGI96_09255 [Bacteroidota bacterium]|nr:hypothetical protein [Bacteroidota bacterium]